METKLYGTEITLDIFAKKRNINRDTTLFSEEKRGKWNFHFRLI
jgi:hypothetical protein